MSLAEGWSMFKTAPAVADEVVGKKRAANSSPATGANPVKTLSKMERFVKAEEAKADKKLKLEAREEEKKEKALQKEEKAKEKEAKAAEKEAKAAEKAEKAEEREKKKAEKEAKAKLPKKPQTAFFIFTMESRPTVVAENPEMEKNVTEIAKILGAKWSALSAEDKAAWDAKAEGDKLRFAKECEEQGVDPKEVVPSWGKEKAAPKEKKAKPEKKADGDEEGEEGAEEGASPKKRKEAADGEAAPKPKKPKAAPKAKKESSVKAAKTALKYYREENLTRVAAENVNTPPGEIIGILFEL